MTACRRVSVRILAAFGAALCAAALLALPAQAKDLPAGWVDTPSGPLSPADRDLLVRVRLAALWEVSAAALSQQRTGSDVVRSLATEVGNDHAELDGQVSSAATELSVALPNEPSAEQRGWLDDLTRASDQEFDQIFVDRLRKAEGQVFPVAAAVRADTRNNTVRTVAQGTVSIVLGHLTKLEGTGLVDYEALQPPPKAPLTKSPPSRTPFADRRGVSVQASWVILGFAVLAALATLWRLVRSR